MARFRNPFRVLRARRIGSTAKEPFVLVNRNFGRLGVAAFHYAMPDSYVTFAKDSCMLTGDSSFLEMRFRYLELTLVWDHRNAK